MSLRSFLFGPGDTSPATDLGVLVLRLGVGLSLAFAHGLGKIPPSPGLIDGTAEMGFPLPLLFAWAAALSEFVGGLLLVIGLATRPAAFFVACTMAVAFFVRHDANFGEGEKAFLILVAALALLLIGAGRYAIDRLLVRERVTYA
jgi:putative oxidoreductase